jgi:tellurite resistance protein
MLGHHRALIYTMVIVSAADSELPDAELRIIADIVGDLPVFRDFDQGELPKAIKAALPSKLRETAYAIACDLVASDGEASQEELRVLELIRYRLSLEPLVAAAIERGAKARFRTL